MAEKISKLALFKGVAELAVSAGTGVVIGNLVKATTPYDISKVQKVLIGIGGYGLSGALSDITAKYVGSQIDSYGDKLKRLLHPEDFAEEATEGEIETPDEVNPLVESGVKIIDALAPETVKEAVAEAKTRIDKPAKSQD